MLQNIKLYCLVYLSTCILKVQSQMMPFIMHPMDDTSPSLFSTTAEVTEPPKGKNFEFSLDDI